MPVAAPNALRRTAIGDLTTCASNRTPDKTAFRLSEDGTGVTFDEFNKLVNQTAHALLDAGHESGDRIGIVGKNSIQILATKYGVLKAGMVTVANDVSLTSEDQKYQFEHSEVDGVFVDDSFFDQVGPFLDENEIDTLVTYDWGGGDAPGIEYMKFLENTSTEEPDIEIQGNDPGVVMYTSGTTSRPKGVLHTHNSYLQGLYNVAVKCDLKHFDVQSGVLPLFHIFQDVFISNALSVSATSVLYREFDPGRLLDDIEQYEMTYLVAMSSMYRTFCDEVDLEGRDVGSIRHIIYGLPMEMGFREKLINDFDATLQATSGQTESGISLFFDPEWQLEKEGNYVGRSGPVNDVAIMDGDGNILPPGETGEIVYRGGAVMAGYLKEEEKTRKAWRHGWHHSEDIGRFDEDGLLLFLDRKKDMIKTGGKNVSSVKVQNVVSEHPAVKECTVVGLPHDRWGEAITAFVVLAGGASASEEEIKEFARENLAGYEAPKAVELVDSFPYTSTGKIRKTELLDQYQDYYSAP